MMSVKGKVKKIHNSSFHDSIGQISACSAQHQGQEIEFQVSGVFLPFTIIKDKTHRCNGQDDKGCTVCPTVGILEKSEDDTRISDRNDVEEVGDDRQALAFEKFHRDQMLCDLVRYENQDRDQDVNSPRAGRGSGRRNLWGRYVHDRSDAAKSGKTSETTEKHRLQTGQSLGFRPVSSR
jgi:hypothetical protein